MGSRRMLFTGEKESFIIRVLMKKVEDEGISCDFVPCTIDSINEAWKDAKLIAIYMEEDKRPRDDVLHFLKDNLDERDTRVIPVGDQRSVSFVYDHMPGELIFKSFVRPVDNADFASGVVDYFSRMEAGEYKKSILVVDDDPQYLGLVRQWLKDTYKVAMVSSGLQALKYLGKNPVDLILLDYEMPVTSGPQVLEMLRSESETENIPVMFLTGKSDKESVMKVVALRPEGYFLKSIQREELLEKLHEYFVMHK